MILLSCGALNCCDQDPQASVEQLVGGLVLSLETLVLALDNLNNERKTEETS